MDVLTFEKAHMVGVSGKISGKAGLVNKVEWAAVCTSAVAEKLDARWVVFDKDQTIKRGFTKIELEYELHAHTLRFVPEGNLSEHVLNLTSESAGSFKLIRKGDGKKKAKKLLVTFKVTHGGSQIPLIEYLERIGGAPGKLEMTPAAVQAKLPLGGEQADGKAIADAVKTAKKAAGPQRVQ